MNGANDRGPLRELLANLAGLYVVGILFASAFMIAGIMVNADVVPTSHQSIDKTTTLADGKFVLEIKENGDVVYTAASGVSEELREELLNTVYQSPDAAEYAVEKERNVLEVSPYSVLHSIGSDAAQAHAVKWCTHKDGVVSNRTGSGQHVTGFLRHENNRHYTRTAHQVLTNSGWQTYDTFNYSVPRSYCGCG
jgi:hypothetical protein